MLITPSVVRTARLCSGSDALVDGNMTVSQQAGGTRERQADTSRPGVRILESSRLENKQSKIC